MESKNFHNNVIMQITKVAWIASKILSTNAEKIRRVIQFVKRSIRTHYVEIKIRIKEKNVITVEAQAVEIVKFRMVTIALVESEGLLTVAAQLDAEMDNGNSTLDNNVTTKIQLQMMGVTQDAKSKMDGNVKPHTWKGCHIV